jgi:NOL1/NOP2/sun family putative RNA methylase
LDPSLPDLPAEFHQRLQRVVPAERLEQCWRTFAQPQATGFRVNTLCTTVPALLAELQCADLAPAPIPFWPAAYQVSPDERRRLTETEAFAAGRLYIQNPSSMIPPLVLAPSPSDWVLDLAAAPGSKTLQLAAMMENQGRISAVESVRSRFFRLRRNLELGGATNVQTYLRDGTSVWRVCPERFDRVLLDAPCSSEGQFRALEPATHAYWSLKKIREMVRKQRRLLYSAVRSLKPGGVLVYSTCTFAPEENEGVVAWALGRFPGALRVEGLGLSLDGTMPGLTAWDGKETADELEQAVRILPDGLMEGFFVCRMRKLSSTLDA